MVVSQVVSGNPLEAVSRRFPPSILLPKDTRYVHTITTTTYYGNRGPNPPNGNSRPIERRIRPKILEPKIIGRDDEKTAVEQVVFLSAFAIKIGKMIGTRSRERRCREISMEK